MAQMRMAQWCVRINYLARGVVGGPLQNIEDIQDIRDPAIHDRIQHDCIQYVPFEFLTQNPMAAVMESFKFNPNKLTTRPHESDSYYRINYRHETRTSVSAAQAYCPAARRRRSTEKL